MFTESKFLILKIADEKDKLSSCAIFSVSTIVGSSNKKVCDIIVFKVMKAGLKNSEPVY